MEHEFSNMWELAKEDARAAYGREYLDAQFRSVVRAAGTAGPNIVPVIDALEDAVSSTSPRVRYLVDGENSWYDHANVSTTNRQHLHNIIIIIIIVVVVV